ncbi:putative Toxin RelG [Desulfamplus magnetovallimortis]|uniref:Putative Toxin RelG n=1 Tax=Desulfamplus magnetovallimortis TaxID=1246637 RepID=A0A1W1HDA5_9BACT|nr:type II toxin-antitoxin system RelE/ParE family toxin [Desulfamplus magnetovallimortis]SLM30358.1 putative Toxin RelG [Desulfamplus magnetovallimortis]
MYRVSFTPVAAEMFHSLHPDIRKEIKAATKELYNNPWLGKHLEDCLASFYSLRVKRYRIIYKVDNEKRIVVVCAIGHRRDVYDVASELL